MAMSRYVYLTGHSTVNTWITSLDQFTIVPVAGWTESVSVGGPTLVAGGCGVGSCCVSQGQLAEIHRIGAGRSDAIAI